jgi:hypothetical protein
MPDGGIGDSNGSGKDSDNGEDSGGDDCWNPPKWVHTKHILAKSGSTDTEHKSRDESRRGIQYLLLTGPTSSYV